MCAPACRARKLERASDAAAAGIRKRSVSGSDTRPDALLGSEVGRSSNNGRSGDGDDDGSEGGAGAEARGPKQQRISIRFC